MQAGRQARRASVVRARAAACAGAQVRCGVKCAVRKRCAWCVQVRACATPEKRYKKHVYVARERTLFVVIRSRPGRIQAAAQVNMRQVVDEERGEAHVMRHGRRPYAAYAGSVTAGALSLSACGSGMRVYVQCHTSQHENKRQPRASGAERAQCEPNEGIGGGETMAATVEVEERGIARR